MTVHGNSDSPGDLPARGIRIELVSTADPTTRLQPGARGTVTYVDGLGTMHVRWEDGSSLGLIPGADHWRVIDEDGAGPILALTIYSTPGANVDTITNAVNEALVALVDANEVRSDHPNGVDGDMGWTWRTSV